MPPHARYSPGGTAKFRQLFKQAVTALGLEHLNLTPGGLRAGGATFKFTTNVLDLGKLKFRGRWASLTTLEHYVQEAAATLIMLRMTEKQTICLESFVAAGEKFQEPPLLPWSVFFHRSRQQNGFVGVLARNSQGRREHTL